jgi:hypothetical protein
LSAANTGRSSNNTIEVKTQVKALLLIRLLGFSDALRSMAVSLSLFRCCLRPVWLNLTSARSRLIGYQPEIGRLGTVKTCRGTEDLQPDSGRTVRTSSIHGDRGHFASAAAVS